MSIKTYASPCVAPSVREDREHLGKSNWLVRLVRRHFELRRQKQQRAEGLETIRKLPRYLQADVGFEPKTNVDD